MPAGATIGYLHSASPHASSVAVGAFARRGVAVTNQPGDEPPDTARYPCPLCQRPPYRDYWRMLGCAGRDLAAAEHPDSPVGALLAARPVPRDDDTAIRRPTVADLTVYAVAALLKVRGDIGDLSGVAATAQEVVTSAAEDRADLRERLAAAERALEQASEAIGSAVARVSALEAGSPPVTPPGGGQGTPPPAVPPAGPPDT